LTNSPNAQGEFSIIMHNFTAEDRNIVEYFNCTIDGMSGNPRISFHDAKNLTLVEHTIFQQMLNIRKIYNEREKQREQSKSTKTM